MNRNETTDNAGKVPLANGAVPARDSEESTSKLIMSQPDYPKNLAEKQNASTEGETFANKLISNPEFQVAIFTEPAREFSEEDKLDLIDNIGEKIFKISRESHVPKFISTFKRENYIIVSAEDAISRDWLKETIQDLKIWEGHQTKSIPAKDIPKARKGLLWLPGRRKIQDAEIMERLGRQNEDLQVKTWRIISRHEEPHGTRLLVAMNGELEQKLKDRGFKPQWSISRAEYTPIEEVARRRRDKYKVGESGEQGQQHQQKQQGRPTTVRQEFPPLYPKPSTSRYRHETAKSNKGEEIPHDNSHHKLMTKNKAAEQVQAETPSKAQKRKPESSPVQATPPTAEESDRDRLEMEKELLGNKDSPFIAKGLQRTPPPVTDMPLSGTIANATTKRSSGLPKRTKKTKNEDGAQSTNLHNYFSRKDRGSSVSSFTTGTDNEDVTTIPNVQSEQKAPDSQEND